MIDTKTDVFRTTTQGFNSAVVSNPHFETNSGHNIAKPEKKDTPNNISRRLLLIFNQFLPLKTPRYHSNVVLIHETLFSLKSIHSSARKESWYAVFLGKAKSCHLQSFSVVRLNFQTKNISHFFDSLTFFRDRSVFEHKQFDPKTDFSPVIEKNCLFWL